MNVQGVCWYLCYGLGILLFFYGIFYLLRKKYVREEHFIKASAFEFLASWILYLPEELFNDVPASLPVLEVLESILTALLRTFNIYLGNDYSRVAYEGHPIFSSLYATLITIVNVTLLLFVAGFILKFLEGPLQQLKFSSKKSRRVFVFPVCNVKTLSIAESIEGQDVNLVFASNDEDLGEAEKQKIKDLHGVYVKGSVSTIIKRAGSKAQKIEVFLFTNSEEDNLAELESICARMEDGIKAPVRVFVELSDTPWDLYDNFLKKHSSSGDDRFIINFVRTEENFVYNNLLKSSIFENAIVREDGKKEIKILIIGMNERNLEMLKAVLHLGQMPGYRLTVMVLDDKAGRDALRTKMPEVYDELDKEGDAIYRLIYKENADLSSIEMIKEEYPDFTFAFINVGEDLKNVNVAMRLNAMRVRRAGGEGYKIQVNVTRQRICNDWNAEFKENLEFVGDLKMTYNYDFITMSDIEKGTIAIHEVRHPKGAKYVSWTTYCNDEYNRHSVYARTLSFKYKVQLIHDLYDPEDELKGTEKEWDIYKITDTDRPWKIYEHMRWNMYTRTMGFVLADKKLLNAAGELEKKTRSVAKVHNDLIDYYDLSKEEQDKDALKLTPEIIQILREI